MMIHESPVKIILLTMVTCGLYAIYYFYKSAEELNARGAEIPAFWWMFIPLLGLLWSWKWAQGVEKVTGGQQSAVMTLVFLMFLGPIGQYLVQSKLNQVQ
ncbi:MAG: DUF4234 domain-containing protein [Myxococcota bacterium]